MSAYVICLYVVITRVAVTYNLDLIEKGQGGVIKGGIIGIDGIVIHGF